MEVVADLEAVVSVVVEITEVVTLEEVTMVETMAVVTMVEVDAEEDVVVVVVQAMPLRMLPLQRQLLHSKFSSNVLILETFFWIDCLG